MHTHTHTHTHTGLATAGFATFPFNPISALCLSTAICMRWTMIGVVNVLLMCLCVANVLPSACAGP